MQKTPISYCSLSGGYSPFSSYWWRELLHYVTGLYVRTTLVTKTLRGERFVWGVPGWWKDITTFYHRGRYGWAPRDVWNMNTHFEKVLAESLMNLAEQSHTYAPTHSPEGWNTQLREWAADLIAFQQFQESDEYTAMLLANAYDAVNAKEAQLVGRRDAALQGIIESWNHLWD